MIMSVVGMPLEMFLVFAATLFVGCAAMIHYVIVHVIMGRPPEENIPRRGGTETEEFDREGPADD
jgi:hypothetical protein